MDEDEVCVDFNRIKGARTVKDDITSEAGKLDGLSVRDDTICGDPDDVMNFLHNRVIKYENIHDRVAKHLYEKYDYTR